MLRRLLRWMLRGLLRGLLRGMLRMLLRGLLRGMLRGLLCWLLRGLLRGLLSGMLQGSNSTRLASPNSIGGLNHDKQSSRAGGERNEAALGAAGRRGRGAGRGVDVFSTDGCATKGGVMAITIDELIEELQRARERIGSGLAGVYLGKGDETKQGRPIVCVTVRTSASPRRVDLT